MRLKTSNPADSASIRRHTAASCYPTDPLLTAREAAAERRQAISTFWRDVKEGRVPPAFYIGPRSPRWRRSEILASIEACRKGRASYQGGSSK